MHIIDSIWHKIPVQIVSVGVWYNMRQVLYPVLTIWTLWYMNSIYSVKLSTVVVPKNNQM